MIGSFLGSRSLLSITMILLGLNCLRDVHPREWLQQKWWLLGLLWVGMFLVSGIWSDNKHEWNVLTQVKMPFLLLPLAFGFLPSFSRKQLNFFTLVFSGIILSGIAFSVSFFVRDPSYYIKGYDFSHVLRTPAYDDHIYFSEAVSLCVFWSVYYFPHLQSKAGKWFIGISVALMVGYLHLLAAKTGLVALYLFIIGWSIYQVACKSWKAGAAILLTFVLAVWAALTFVPTFRSRVNYIHYSYEQYEQKNYSGDYGDIGRIMSYEIGGKIIEANPILGVGAGDALDAMKEGYNKWHPQVADEQRLLPHNEFMVMALATGIPSLLFFCWWVIAPFARMKRNRESVFYLLGWLMLMVPMMIDPMLEVQMGVFVFVFFLLWFRHVLLQAD